MKKLNLAWSAILAIFSLFSFFSLFSLFSLSSCSKAPHLRPGYLSPEEVVSGYHDSLRWQDYDTAKMMVSPRAIKAWEAFMAESEGKLNIIDYKVMAMEVGNGGYTARVKIKRKFFIYPKVASKEEEFIQTWELIGGRWLLSGPPF